MLNPKITQYSKKILSNSNFFLIYIFAVISYRIVENIVYLVITDKKYSQKLAFCLLEDLNNLFIDEMKSMFGSIVDYYSKVETINKEYFFYKFGKQNYLKDIFLFFFLKILIEKVLRRKKDEYENQNSRDNLDKIKKEILDVQQIMNENINLLIDRESLFNSVSSMSSTMKDDSHKLYDRARKTRYSLLLRKYSVLIAIVAMVLLFVIFKFVL